MSDDEGSKRSAPGEFASWPEYWQAQGMPWRTEPKIDEERQRYLAERRAITPDARQGVYPFRDITLTRADMEWLLEVHESHGMRGPVDADAEAQEERAGLDVRGADLRGVNLSGLPLARLEAGPTGAKYVGPALEMPGAAVVHLECANLDRATLDEANLREAQLQGASLVGARLAHAFLTDASLVHANLRMANLQETVLSEAHLGQVDCFKADMQGLMARQTQCEGACFNGANLQAADFLMAHLQQATFVGADLRHASLIRAKLQGANLSAAHLEGSRMVAAALEGTSLTGSHLAGTNLQRVTCDLATGLDSTTFGDAEHGGAKLRDVFWGPARLSLATWSSLQRVGEEQEAFNPNDREGQPKDAQRRLHDFQDAALTNRQLAAALRQQGLNEDADRFAYRAHLIQHVVLWRQHHHLRWLGSLFLWLIAGYGYRPLRSFATYLLVVVGFAAIYLASGGTGGHALTWNEALVVSFTAFHGRGFLASAFQPGDPQAAVAAIEAVIGLLIEITLIATFTQRFFSR